MTKGIPWSVAFLLILFAVMPTSKALADACTNASRIQNLKGLIVYLDYEDPPKDVPDLSRQRISDLVKGSVVGNFSVCFGRDNALPLDILYEANDKIFSPNNLILYVKINILKTAHFSFETKKEQFNLSYQLYRPGASDQDHFLSLREAGRETWLFEEKDGEMIGGWIYSTLNRYLVKQLGIDDTPAISEHGDFFHVQ